MFTINDFKIDDRVEIHPALDRWMRGDRCGTVEHIGSKLLRVRMDVSESLIRILPGNIKRILE
jgi:hypothetical protein